MNSREIVRRTLDFEGPERVAIAYAPSDFAGAGFHVETPATDWKEVGGGRWERIDEWGNLWARVDKTSKGEVAKGVLDSLDQIETYRFPDFSRPEDYASSYKSREANPDKWIIGLIPGFAFNIARKMRRLDQYLMDLIENPEPIRLLHDRIDAMVADMIRNYGAAGIDSVMFAEDWGTQYQTLVSPALWHEEFFPRFKRLCDLAHSYNMRVLMHSCGQISGIIPGLIEAGIDVLQLDQPDLLGIDFLAGFQEKARITYWCPVDIQKTLQTRDEAVIRGKAREMLDKLWRGRGGFMATRYPDDIAIGLDPVWQDHACDEFVRRGVRARYNGG